MSKDHVGSLLRSAILSAGVIVCVGLVEIRPAMASCGDWLDHGAKPMSTDQGTEEKLADRSTENRNSNEPARCPCRGAQCRQAPAHSAPIPVVPTVQSDKDVTCGNADGCVLAASPFLARLLLHRASALSGFPDLIDHPPRA